MSPSTTNAYKLLLNDRLALVSQSWGKTGNRILSLTPLPDCPNPEQSIARWVNLFANYDPRPRDEWGEYPTPPTLRRRYDLSYINITEDNLLSTLVNYFESALPREMGRTVFTNKNSEEGPDIDFVYGESEVKAFAAECAQAFISNEIHTHMFMLESDNRVAEEYRVAVC